MRDPRIRVVTVATDEITEMAVKTAKQDQYHGINVEMYSTMDQALKAARKHIAKANR